ncbi:hypothetical protein MHYP_G00139130 [Metynnis hypsauchen]
MDPAELDPIKSALQNQGAAIGRHEQLLHDMMQQLTLLVRAQAEGAQPASTGTGAAAGASAAAPALASPLPPTDPTPIRGEASVANPERYAGDPETCRGFLLQCSLVFEQQPSRFPTERSKVAYMISLLTGRALAWATSLWERASPDTASGESFMSAMRTTFHNPRGGREAAPRLLALSQGTCSSARDDARCLGVKQIRAPFVRRLTDYKPPRKRSPLTVRRNCISSSPSPPSAMAVREPVRTVAASAVRGLAAPRRPLLSLLLSLLAHS